MSRKAFQYVQHCAGYWHRAQAPAAGCCVRPQRKQDRVPWVIQGPCPRAGRSFASRAAKRRVCSECSSAALAHFLSLTFQQEFGMIKKGILLLCWQGLNQLLGQKRFSETTPLNHPFDQRPAQSTFFLLQTGIAKSLNVLKAHMKDKARCI